MSEVMRHGKSFFYKKASWYGVVADCKYCGCQFKITADTAFHHPTGGNKVATVTCPECGCTELEVSVEPRTMSSDLRITIIMIVIIAIVVVAGKLL
jgi:hypothetical protein